MLSESWDYLQRLKQTDDECDSQMISLREISSQNIYSGMFYVQLNESNMFWINLSYVITLFSLDGLRLVDYLMAILSQSITYIWFTAI